MVIELCGVLYKVVLGLDSSGEKLPLRLGLIITSSTLHIFFIVTRIYFCRWNILCSVHFMCSWQLIWLWSFQLGYQSEEAYDCPKHGLRTPNEGITDAQWRNKSKKSESLGQCGRTQTIWEWELIFARAVKAIFSPGASVVRGPKDRVQHLI